MVISIILYIQSSFITEIYIQSLQVKIFPNTLFKPNCVCYSSLVECVRSKDGKEHKDSKKKFSVQNIKQTSGKIRSSRFQAGETEETKDLSLSQLERAVLLDQLKFYRMQLNELESKKEEIKKQEKSTVNVLEERDCISV